MNHRTIFLAAAAGIPHVLFTLSEPLSTVQDVSPNGQRFIIVMPAQ
jgi:hypothetical protein